MSASQRRKGAVFERRIAKELSVAGYQTNRNLDQYQESSGRDLTIDAPFCFQLKCGARPNYRTALREAQDSCGSDYAVAITHEDYGNTTVHMDWHDFLDILSLPDVRRALQRAPLDPSF